MDRRYDKLLRSYDDPKQLYQRLADDKDLLGFVLVNAFLKYKGLERCDCDPDKDDCHHYPAYRKQHQELRVDFWAQFTAEFCDCGTAPASAVLPPLHLDDCNLRRAWRDMQKTWGPYILRKNKEFLHEARLNR